YISLPSCFSHVCFFCCFIGDAQVYMRSAIFNADVAPFHKKWIQDLHDSQWVTGAYPVYSPMTENEQGVAAIPVF
ncbi:hypothetical protein, partial [Sphingobacterium daejeonense]|uniref:alpha-L-rhamnosidase-related protein n=1 Tax=Sphingobacterium daejeonense TaxID=371142 RepID=UPI003D31DCDD